MPATKSKTGSQRPLAGRFDSLVEMMPPQAIRTDSQLERTLSVIDRLMSSKKLTHGQALYLETLVQLVQAYQAERHRIDTADLSGIDSLRHFLAENQMNASDLARLLGVHASMGSKILNGERSLTVDHVRKLAARFKVRPEMFIS
jgi:HTH-type transcriptional regulator / antitoxin HigA